MKIVSIVIPCHNCADSVYESFQSVKDQSYPLENIECIFVDDASTDAGKTWDALCQIEQEAPSSVKLIGLDENLRQGGARNVGISYADGDYLLFLDADDRLEPTALERLVQIADETGAGLIQFNHTVHCGEQSLIQKNVETYKEIEITKPEDRVPLLNATQVTYGCWNKLYRMDLVKNAQVKFAEHVVYEEPLFVYPCFFYVSKVVLLPEVFYINEMHANSTVTSSIGKRLLDHPSVQLQVLEYCLHRPEIYQTYHDVIGLYFLWSYYCETLCFAGQRADAFLPLAYFQEMQVICKKMFPDWRQNPYVKIVSKNVLAVLDTIEQDYKSQEELQGLIRLCQEVL